MTETNIERVGKLFAIDTAQHEMTILLDEGLHRHVRFMRPRPGSSSYWYELITVPHALIFRGDYESLVFSRTEDMFGFFRSNPDRPAMRISPDYWAEKLTSDRGCVKRYDQDKFEQIVKELTVAAIRAHSAPRGIGRAVREQILNDEDIHYEDGARRALDDFEFGAKNVAECPCGGRVEVDADLFIPASWRDQHPRGLGHPYKTDHVPGFRFTDTWELDFKDFDHGYLWACHAIVAGIAQYDAAKAQAARPVETVAVPS